MSFLENWKVKMQIRKEKKKIAKMKKTLEKNEEKNG